MKQIKIAELKDHLSELGRLPNQARDRRSPLNGTVYFSATDGVHGYELWRTGGAPVRRQRRGSGDDRRADRRRRGCAGRLLSATLVSRGGQ
ncbi:MAG: hypothetical protein SF182_28760 [Deltaproteobacteria bacterium]|nr:hypothetical protein [Deltaproteobacteria bacterium]